MKIAVMQPYFFPNIGYYQLAYSVDEFICFDDVNFIKKGFIHRNSILSNGEKIEFVIPVKNASRNRTILEHFYVGEYNKFLKQVSFSYKKAPYFTEVYSLIQKVIYNTSDSVAEKNSASINAVFEYCEIKKSLSNSSDLSIPNDIKGKDRILEICRIKKAGSYHNLMGGKELYDCSEFKKNNINLKFIRNTNKNYSQYPSEFVPNLSIIDLMMWNNKKIIINILKSYELN